MEKRISTRELAAVKRTAMNVAPIVAKKNKAKSMIEKWTEEYNVQESALAGYESGLMAQLGLRTEQVVTKVVESTGKFDKNGKCLNPNFMDYKVPMIRDLPENFKCELVEVDDHLGPYGGKSISEISTNGAAPAIGIAIYNAIGIWMQEWPFTAEYVYRAIQRNEDKPLLYDFETGMKK